MLNKIWKLEFNSFALIAYFIIIGLNLMFMNFNFGTLSDMTYSSFFALNCFALTIFVMNLFNVIFSKMKGHVTSVAYSKSYFSKVVFCLLLAFTIMILVGMKLTTPVLENVVNHNYIGGCIILIIFQSGFHLIMFFLSIIDIVLIGDKNIQHWFFDYLSEDELMNVNVTEDGFFNEYIIKNKKFILCDKKNTFTFKCKHYNLTIFRQYIEQKSIKFNDMTDDDFVLIEILST